MKLAASLLIAAVCLLAALPALASAENYVVNETGDAADAAVGSEGCDSVAGGAKQCTLRAAIQESNNSTGVRDEVSFDPSFNGQLVDTIALGAGFPIITDPVTIDGDGASQCMTAAGIDGPCVGVSGPSGGFGLQVEDDAVVIEGLAVTGALTGINVINASDEFTARGNWIGVKLDGNASANNTGLFIDPDSNFALIGSPAATGRNVIAGNNNVGLDIEGADSAVVQGNYFGVAPNGATPMPNPINIELTDSTAGGGFQAEENEIGGTVSPAAQATDACDGDCNVISGATSMGVDLHGNGAGQNEAPASGPTAVRGNYVGLSSGGGDTVANATVGINTRSSEDTTIGGPENADANFIAGGGTGIYHENGEGFAALGNVIGSMPGGGSSPPNLGMFVFCGTNANPVVVDANVIEMEGGTGIEQRFGGAEITQNFIEGAQFGILTFADPGAAGGNLIEDNVIGESVISGIQIENDDNEVIDNAIFDSGGPGIRIQNQGAFVQATENVIGGDTAADENTIRESGADAIEIIDTSGALEPSFNEVARNHGDKNGALFIDLIGALANDGILPPSFTTSQQTSASGNGAEAGATVRVFRKGEAGPGEIESFLAETTADKSGNWKVTYPTIPTGTLVAATQTSAEGATSELAIKAAAADPSGGGGGGAGGGGDDGKDKKPGKGKGKGKAGKDKSAPQTTILKKRIKGRTAKFKFVSSEAGSTFQCKLDRGKFKPCRSPKKYRRLKPGKHVFQVRAVDAAGNKDKTPATRRFRVLPPR